MLGEGEYRQSLQCLCSQQMDEHEVSSYHFNNGTVGDVAYKGLRVELAVGPQDLNQLADDLTNQKFDSFPSDKGIQFVGGDTKLLVLDSLMHKAQEFYEELAREKKRKISNPKPKGANKKKKIDPW